MEIVRNELLTYISMLYSFVAHWHWETTPFHYNVLYIFFINSAYNSPYEWQIPLYNVIHTPYFVIFCIYMLRTHCRHGHNDNTEIHTFPYTLHIFCWNLNMEWEYTTANVEDEGLFVCGVWCACVCNWKQKNVWLCFQYYYLLFIAIGSHVIGFLRYFEIIRRRHHSHSISFYTCLGAFLQTFANKMFVPWYLPNRNIA